MVVVMVAVAVVVVVVVVESMRGLKPKSSRHTEASNYAHAVPVM